MKSKVFILLWWWCFDCAYHAKDMRFSEGSCIECKRVTKLTFNELLNRSKPVDQSQLSHFLFLLKLYRVENSGKVVTFRKSCLNTKHETSMQKVVWQPSKPNSFKIRHKFDNLLNSKQSSESFRSRFNDSNIVWWWKVFLFFKKAFNRNVKDVCLQCAKHRQFETIDITAMTAMEQFLHLVLGPKSKRNLKDGKCKLTILNRDEGDDFIKTSVENNITFDMNFPKPNVTLIPKSTGMPMGGESVVPKGHLDHKNYYQGMHQEGLKMSSLYMNEHWYRTFTNHLKLQCYQVLKNSSKKMLPRKPPVTSSVIHESWYNSFRNSLKLINFMKPITVSSKNVVTHGNFNANAMNEVWYTWFLKQLRLQCKNPNFKVSLVLIKTKRIVIIKKKLNLPEINERWYIWLRNTFKLKSHNPRYLGKRNQTVSTHNTIAPMSLPSHIDANPLIHSTNKLKFGPGVKALLVQWNNRNYGGEATDSALIVLFLSSYMLFMLKHLSGFFQRQHASDTPETQKKVADFFSRPAVKGIELEWIIAIVEISPHIEQSFAV